MKKYMVLCAGLSLAVAFTSCKSSEKAYKKAYEKALAQDQQQQQTVITDTPVQQQTTPVVTPVETRQQPETSQPVATQPTPAQNVSVREERISVVSGVGLKDFSVVVGSFRQRTNAENLQTRLRNAGNDAQIVYNSERDMYRVVAATFDNKADAAASRDSFRSQFPEAWLLFNAR